VTRPLRLWREALLVAVFYFGYSLIRSLFGSASVSAGEAYANTQKVITIEQHLGLFHEQTVQSWFVDWHIFMKVWDTFYGLAHFVVPLAVLLWAFVKWPADYRLLRNTLALTTALGLVGFALFPVMPPRLLCDCAWGAGPAVAHYGFVDTVVVDGGFWSFGSAGVSALSNQYAAMPSLHMAWSLWCAYALWPRARRWWWRVLTILYPLATLFAVIVTANHFFLDAIGGVAAVTIGCVVGTWCTGWAESRRRSASREDLSGVLVAEAASGVPLDSRVADHR
jgi:hypothetical protein